MIGLYIFSLKKKRVFDKHNGQLDLSELYQPFAYRLGPWLGVGVLPCWICLVLRRWLLPLWTLQLSPPEDPLQWSWCLWLGSCSQEPSRLPCFSSPQHSLQNIRRPWIWKRQEENVKEPWLEIFLSLAKTIVSCLDQTFITRDCI